MKAAIFDLDGVILSTDDLHYEAWKKIADQEGIYFDREINNRLRGVSRMASLEIILENADREYSLEEKEKLAEEKNGYYRELLKTITPDAVFDGVRETIDALKKKGIRVAIGSSSKNTKFILKQIGMLEEFDAISDGNNITHSKPDPEVFLKAAEMLDIEPEDCVVIEDAIAGIEAAKAGKMRAAAVGDARKSKLADDCLDDIRDLLNLFD